MSDVEKRVEACPFCGRDAERGAPAAGTERETFQRLSMALTKGNAATWDEVIHAAEQAAGKMKHKPWCGFGKPDSAKANPLGACTCGAFKPKEA